MIINVDPYKIGDFTQNKPSLRQEHWKTYYCVFELKNDFHDTRIYGIGNKANEWYKKGYYVIPIYLGVEHWLRGDCVIMYPRQFQSLFGEPLSGEPQDVSRENWWLSRDFKRYFGIVENWTCGYELVSENPSRDDFPFPPCKPWKELYDDVHEAIKRAKSLDNLMSLSDKHYQKKERLKKLLIELDHLNTKIHNYEYRKTTYPKNFSKQAQLSLELKLITKENKTNLINKLKKEIAELESKMTCPIYGSIELI